MEASAAQNAPVNKICSLCGAVLSSRDAACQFCNDSQIPSLLDPQLSTQGNLALSPSAPDEWRGELNQKLQAYRAKRKKATTSDNQAELPFHAESAPLIAVAEPSQRFAGPSDDFAFTVAIGRPPRKDDPEDPRLLIDVSLRPEAPEAQSTQNSEQVEESPSKLFPVASIEDRRRAAFVDAACLAFAYGGFLALFGSLGGHFTFSKLSAAVCFFTFAFVYIQYFGLFTIFGGTTPGMMVCGLYVASCSGDEPSARQLALRALGYLISASTFFLGLLWSLWDEDGMTWHDRLSDTYLTVPDTFAEAEITHAPVAR